MTARRWSIGAAVVALAVMPATPAIAAGPDEQVVEPGLAAESSQFVVQRGAPVRIEMGRRLVK